MKNIIKQNMVLFAVIFSGIALSAILILMIFYKNNQRLESIDKFDQLKSKIASLYNSKPSPTGKNIELLTKDIYDVKKATFNFENVFGNIYQQPIMAMIKTINEITAANLNKKINNSKLTPAEIETIQKQIEAMQNKSEYDFQQNFLANWKAFIEKVKQAEIEVKISELLNRFGKERGLTVEELKKLEKAFSEALYKTTFEDINESNAGEYILEALGINVPYSRVRCKTLVLNIQQSLIKYLQDAGVKMPDNRLELFQELATLPDDSQIPYIIQYSRFLDDLFSRVADSKPDSIISYKRMNGLKGNQSGNFTIIKYQIEFIAHQSEIRAFLNSLQSAYKDSRMYIVKKVRLSTPKDEAEQIKPYDPASENLQSKIKVMLDLPNLIDAVIDIEYITYNRTLS